MKILVIILKILILIATGVCSIVFNLLGSISMLATGQAEEYKILGEVVFWLVFTVVCYIVPAFIIMFKKYIIPAVMSFCGMICVLVLHGMLSGAGKELYLQLLIVTILTIVLAIIAEWNKLIAKADERYKKKTAEAPSILGGTTKADINVKVANNKRKNR